MNVLAGEADVGGGSSVPHWNGCVPATLPANNLARSCAASYSSAMAALRQRSSKLEPGFAGFARIGLAAVLR